MVTTTTGEIEVGPNIQVMEILKQCIVQGKLLVTLIMFEPLHLGVRFFSGIRVVHR